LSRLALTLASFAVLVAGCGGDDQPGRTVTAPANGAVRILAKEYSFDPSTIIVPKPGRLRITLVNKGSLAHNLVLEGKVPIVPTLRAGETKTTDGFGLECCEYEFVCTVGDHAELGMRGTIKVED
jgi:plastocyanin